MKSDDFWIPYETWYRSVDKKDGLMHCESRFLDEVHKRSMPAENFTFQKMDTFLVSTGWESM